MASLRGMLKVILWQGVREEAPKPSENQEEDYIDYEERRGAGSRLEVRLS
jgi:hypothetical protein